jgi:hypothetical protein
LSWPGNVAKCEGDVTGEILQQFRWELEMAGMIDDPMTELKLFQFMVEDCKRFLGEWDTCDPVSWEILRVIEAQNDLATAYEMHGCYSASYSVLEQAFAERLKAIAALQKAIKENPYGPA